MSGEDSRVKISAFETSLAVAIDLRDGVAGGRPKGAPSVTLANRPETFKRTPGGYHVLTDVSENVGEVTIVVDGGSAHLDERRAVDLGAIDRATPETVELPPSPAYPFSSGTTLVRGIVTDASDAPVADAPVTIQGRSESTRTSQAGEYALPIRSIESAHVNNGALRVCGGTPTLEAAHPESETTTTGSMRIPVGETSIKDIQF